jgi:hypothetical protein
MSDVEKSQIEFSINEIHKKDENAILKVRKFDKREYKFVLTPAINFIVESLKILEPNSETNYFTTNNEIYNKSVKSFIDVSKDFIQSHQKIDISVFLSNDTYKMVKHYSPLFMKESSMIKYCLIFQIINDMKNYQKLLPKINSQELYSRRKISLNDFFFERGVVLSQDTDNKNRVRFKIPIELFNAFFYIAPKSKGWRLKKRAQMIGEMIENSIKTFLNSNIIKFLIETYMDVQKVINFKSSKQSVMTIPHNSTNKKYIEFLNSSDSFCDILHFSILSEFENFFKKESVLDVKEKIDTLLNRK